MIDGGSCKDKTVCNEGVCVNKICPPHKLDCFSTMDQVAKDYYEPKVIEAKEKSNTFEVNLLVFACNSIGSEYEIVTKCEGDCNPHGTAIVDIDNVGFEDLTQNEYQCGCTDEDTQASNHPAKTCKLVKNGKEGKCVDKGQNVFECE